MYAKSPPSSPLSDSLTHVPQNPDVLLLTYNVTYWDRLGWKDTFGNPAWDARQNVHVKRWSRDRVFTPQLVIDGVSDGVGRRDGEITELLSKAIQARNDASFTVGIERVSEHEVRIASEQVEALVHEGLLIVYDPEKRTVKIEEGENKRKSMAHLNVVKDVVRIEEWRGGVKKVDVPQIGEESLKRVIIVQQGAGGAIVAALKI